MADAAKPKVVYFNIQGRAQSFRYLLAHKGVEYEDVRITFEEWGAAKSDGTYTAPGGQLPAYIDADGTKRSQQLAILNYLCAQHNVVPATADEEYELYWYFETVKDHDNKANFGAIFTEGAPEDIINGFINDAKALYDKMEERWADGRVHAAGANITAADYYLLSQYTQAIINPNLRNPIISQTLGPYAAAKPNCMRVINSIKAELQSTVDALPNSWI